MQTGSPDASADFWLQILLAALDWPFLLFLLLTLFAVLFRDRLLGLLERGDIQISWGPDRHIKLRELSEGLDQELDPIRDDLHALRRRLERLEAAGPAAPDTAPISAPDAPAHPDAAAPPPEAADGSAENNWGEDGGDGCVPAERRRHAEQRMIEGLRNPRFRWRSLERLAGLAAVPVAEATDILRGNREVVLSLDKSQRPIARLRSR